MTTRAVDRLLQITLALGSLRRAVTVLLLLLLAGGGMFVLTGTLLVLAVLGGPDGWAGLVSDLALTVGGFAVAAVVPAVGALALLPRHPVAAGTVAAFVGALAVCLCGPHAGQSQSALLVAFGGLLLVVCAVPLPPPRTRDRFAG